MKNKYGAKRTLYKGRYFHSKKEAEVAHGLDNLIERGVVHAWFPQITLHLRGFGGNFLGKKYIADFLVFTPDTNQAGKEILTAEIWDSKGVVTSTYKIKKSVLTCQGIDIIDNLQMGGRV